MAIGLKELIDAFHHHCAGDRVGLDGRGFVGFCKDCKLIDRKLLTRDADIIFAKSLPKGHRRMELLQLDAALRLIAGKRGEDVEKVMHRVAAVSKRVAEKEKEQQNGWQNDLPYLMPYEQLRSEESSRPHDSNANSIQAGDEAQHSIQDESMHWHVVALKGLSEEHRVRPLFQIQRLPTFPLDGSSSSQSSHDGVEDTTTACSVAGRRPSIRRLNTFPLEEARAGNNIPGPSSTKCRPGSASRRRSSHADVFDRAWALAGGRDRSRARPGSASSNDHSQQQRVPGSAAERAASRSGSKQRSGSNTPQQASSPEGILDRPALHRQSARASVPHPQSRPSSATASRQTTHVGRLVGCTGGSGKTPSAPLSARRSGVMVAHKPTPSEQDALKQVFYGLCEHEVEGMDSRCFAHLCKNCYLFGGNFQRTDLESVFGQVVPNGRSHMNFDQFNAALRQVAAMKGADPDYPRRVVEALAPNKPYVRRHSNADHSQSGLITCLAANRQACGGA